MAVPILAAIQAPDAQTGARIVTAFVYQRGYKDEIENANGVMVPNPETKAQAFRRLIQEFIMSNVRTYEAAQAAELARTVKLIEVNQQLSLT